MLIFSLVLSVVISNYAGIINTSEDTNAAPPASTVALPTYILYVEENLYHCYDTVAKIDKTSRDCTNLMAEVIRECPESGSIAIKPGVYVCDLFVNKKLFIRGEGRAATTIHGTITLDSTLVAGTPVCQHSVIQNLRLDGQSRLGVGIRYESSVTSVPLITVRDVDVENYVEKGISFINASDCLFENVVVGNCPVGIYYTTNHNFGRIKGCELLNYREMGVYTDAQIYLSDTVFSGMQISPEKADLVLDNAFGTVIGCWFENNRTEPYAPCIDMPSTCYRPLTVMSCFFANRGGVIIRVRNVCEVLIIGNFFSQQNNQGKGCCTEVVEGQVYWSNNVIDSAFAATLTESCAD